VLADGLCGIDTAGAVRAFPPPSGRRLICIEHTGSELLAGTDAGLVRLSPDGGSLPGDEALGTIRDLWRENLGGMVVLTEAGLFWLTDGCADPEPLAASPGPGVFSVAGERSRGILYCASRECGVLSVGVKFPVASAEPTAPLPLGIVPNPVLGGPVRFLCDLPGPSSKPIHAGLSGGADSVWLEIYSVRGQLVRRLGTADLIRDAAVAGWLWDGCDGEGFPVPAGVYVAKAGLGREYFAGKFVKIR